MAEMNQFHNEKILCLATAFRGEFSDDENSESPETSLEFLQTCQQPGTDLPQFIRQIDDESTTQGIERPKPSFGVDVKTWNQAFSKLRPPLSIGKRRQLHTGMKFTNKSCLEILQVVGSYAENLDSDKERKGDWEMENEEMGHHLCGIEGAECADDSEGWEFQEEIGEPGETPIPRNLTRF